MTPRSLRADLAQLRFDTGETKVFFGVLLALVVAKGFTLLPLSYATDDVSFATSPGYNNPAVLDQGRVGLYLLRALNLELGIYPTHANLLTGFLALVAVAWSAVIVCRAWGLQREVMTATTVGAIYALHPFTVEYFTFRVALHSMFYEYFLGFLAIHVARWRWSGFVVATALVAVVSAKNQVILTFLVVTTLFALLVRLAVSDRSGEEGPWQAIRESRAIPRFASILAGVGLYSLLNAGLRAMGVGALRGERLVPVHALRRRLEIVGEQVKTILWQDDPLVAPLAQKIILLFIVLATALLIWRVARAPRIGPGAKVGWISANLLLLGAAGTAVFTVPIVAHDLYTASRVVASYGLFVAGVVALAAKATARPWLEKAIVGLGCLVALSFAASNNRILTEQIQTNVRDFHQASRIVGRLEASAAFDPSRPVAVVGRARPVAPLGTSVGDLNQSAFSRPWSRSSILRVVSGYPLPSPDAEQAEAAREHCAKAPAWPAVGSVSWVDGLGIVCLSPEG